MELLGGMPDVARFVVAFLLVLGLIGAGADSSRRLRVLFLFEELIEFLLLLDREKRGV